LKLYNLLDKKAGNKSIVLKIKMMIVKLLYLFMRYDAG